MVQFHRPHNYKQKIGEKNMNEKDFNLAILNKLYEIAEAVWAKMAKLGYLQRFEPSLLFQ